MRLFVAIFPPDEVIKATRRVLASPVLAHMKWVVPENLHVTLKFIGEEKVENMSIYRSVLDRSSSEVRPFRLALGGAGAFPSSERPRVLWTGVQGEVEVLEKLALRLEREIS